MTPRHPQPRIQRPIGQQRPTAHRAWLVAVFMILAAGRISLAQDSLFPQATPNELGLQLPDAPPLAGGDRRVLFGGEGDPLVVAKVYLEVADHYVLLMTDGGLICRPIRDTTPTDRPFEPAEDKKQLAKQLTQQRFAGFKTRSTRRYLYVYNTSEAFATATSRILESIYPALTSYCRRQRLRVEEARFPLVVIMFRTQEEFEKYRPVPPGVTAYYNAISNHVVMFEQSKLAEVAPELAFKQAVSTIAHEGVHQILHNIGVQKRLSRWPLWFSEGLAEYFAPTELDRRVRWKGVGFVNDLRLHELSEFYRARNGAKTGGELIRTTVEAKTLDSLGYATSWALVHYLARFQRDEFRQCLQEVSQIEPLQSLPPGSVFDKHVGNDYGRIETDLVGYLRTLPYVDPVLNQTHFVMLIQGTQRAALVTSSPLELEGFVRDNASKGPYRVQAFPHRAAAEFFVKNWLSQP